MFRKNLWLCSFDKLDIDVEWLIINYLVINQKGRKITIGIFLS